MKTRLMMAAALLVSAQLATSTEARQQRRVLEPQQMQRIQNRIPLDNLNRGGWNGLGNRVGVAAPVVLKGFDGVLTARRISQAIDDGVLYLKRQQVKDGSIGESHYARGGSTALAALAMLASGANPVSNPHLGRALSWLKTIEPDNTYVRGIRANVWEYALRKVPGDEGYRKALWADAEWLLQALGDGKAWRYNMRSTDWDNSCSQYGVLGLWAAERAGFDPGEGFWQKMSEHFRAVQNEDGGWGYITGGSTSNMATAGLASMFLVFDMHHGRSFYSQKNPRAFKEGAAADVLASVERGMEWIGKNHAGSDNGYYLYGIERTGVASGRKYFGGRDWFKEGAMVALKQQRADGSIPNSYTPVIGTAFSTLFLVYGGAPVAMNKLQYGEGHDWNLNPRDLANVSRYLWSAYERPLNWHTVSVDDPVEEFGAPILFISGTEAARFNSDQVAKLRDYIQRGGTILAEPSDHAPAFRESMESLVGELFPAAEYPDRVLAPIDPGHAVFTASNHLRQRTPKLRGVSDGSRLVFLLSDEYFSATWQKNETVEEPFSFTMSLLFYVTDQRPLAGRFATDLPSHAAMVEREKALNVGRVVVDGTPDADTAGRSWARFGDYFAHRTGARIKDLGTVGLTPAGLAGVDLLHLTGKRAFTLSVTQKGALAAFVDSGGTVLVDAWAGAEPFAMAARHELEGLFGALEPLPASDPVVSGNFEGGSDLSRQVRFTLPARRALQKRAGFSRGQQLQVARRDGRAAVFFSSLDLSAAMAGVAVYGAIGYQAESARRIVTNLGGWLVRET